MSMGSATRAVAADDTFETWPKKPAEPVVAPEPVPDASGAGKTWEMWPIKRSEPVIRQTPVTVTGADGAAGAEDAAEKKTATGRSYGTIGWIALGIAAAIGIAVAAGGGGGGSGAVTNPGHQ